MSRTARLAALVAAALLLTGCSGGSDSPAAAPTTSPTTSTGTSGASTGPAAPVTAEAVPGPERDVCHQMTWDQALAPTDTSATASCDGEHTAETYSVGELRTVVDGHLLAVDSARVQRQVAQVCPRRLLQVVGGSQDDLRLSMLRAIWFTPTVEESDDGANWLRCDAIVVAREGELAPLTSSLRGALATPQRRADLSMCGTAQPGAADFRRVLCRDPHRWRAVEVVDLPRGAYPGEQRVRAAGQDVCEEAGRARADDSLDFQWGYEWPSAEQWTAGQTWGRCWAPDTA